MQARVLIGTSGWMYDQWEGIFYPAGMRKDQWLSFYMKQFDTVEINNTFYHLPSPEAFEGWRMSARKGFIYALKGSRYITHMKKLKDPDDPLRRFMDRASLLRRYLGPVLFQLPPRWRCNTQRLEEFVRLLPSGIRFAFEFRDESWFNKEVYDILSENGMALCIYHMPGLQSPIEVTAPFVYLRFHGSDFLYAGRYSKKEISGWASLIKGYLKAGLDVYAYFNNDAEGNAVINAKELKEMTS